MTTLDVSLFLWINATSATPAWLLALARFASLELPQLLLAGTVGALVAGDAPVRQHVLRILFAMLAAWVIARLGQHLIAVPRPFVLGIGTAWLPHGSSSGFPSTHASVAFAFAAAVAASTRHSLAAAASFALAAVIAWSRVGLGLHFPFDVAAGALVGIAASWFSGWIPPRAPALSGA